MLGKTLFAWGIIIAVYGFLYNNLIVGIIGVVSFCLGALTWDIEDEEMVRKILREVSE